MSDYYTLLAYIQNAKPDQDVLGSLNDIIKTENEMKTNDITDIVIADDVDEFAEGKKQQVVDNFKEPRKNKRRINIPDAEVKDFHYGYSENVEEYYESDEYYPADTPEEFREYPTATPEEFREYPTDNFSKTEEYPSTTSTKPKTLKTQTKRIKKSSKKSFKKNKRRP